MHEWTLRLDSAQVGRTLPHAQVGTFAMNALLMTDNKPEQPPKRSPFQGAGAAYLPISGVLVGAGIGWLIDQAHGRFPLWTVICALVFTGAGFYHMIKEGSK